MHNTEPKAGNKLSRFERFLTGLEKLGNKLPSPFMMFFWLFAASAVASLVVSLFGVSLINPATQELVYANNFFSAKGVVWFLKNLVTNFTGYAPFGLVLVMTLGIGLCEEVGFVNAFIRRVMANVPKNIVPYAVVLIGLLANVASDSSMIVIPPLAAIVYLGVGRHPIAGMLTGYAAANMGFAGNFIISGTDALISGISTAAAQSILPGTVVEATSNWYFKMASAVMLTVLFGLVSTYLVEPRFGKYEGVILSGEDSKITSEEKKSLRVTGLAALFYTILLAAGLFSGVLMHPETGSIIGSPFLSGIVPIFFLFFFICGLVYGKSIGVIKEERDISKALIKRIAGMAPYIVMSFMSAQFISLFTWSNLGTILSIGGANGLSKIGLTGVPLFVGFILLTAMLDFLIGSGSAKWAVMAPIFIPMFALMGFAPAFTQMAYRIGDSASNVMAPTSAILFMMLGEAQQKYDKKTTLGTFLSCQFIFFGSALLTWILLFIIWMLLGLAVGPSSPIYM